MTTKHKTTTDAVSIIYRRYFKTHPKQQLELEDERFNAKIARTIHRMREQHILTQVICTGKSGHEILLGGGSENEEEALQYRV